MTLHDRLLSIESETGIFYYQVFIKKVDNFYLPELNDTPNSKESMKSWKKPACRTR